MHKNYINWYQIKQQDSAVLGYAFTCKGKNSDERKNPRLT
jgi:hypothetical protein